STILESEGEKESPAPTDAKPYGLVAVAVGDGVAEIFRSLGVDSVIQGGQTMNPSTEEIVQAVKNLHAEHILVLPNNKNIIMSAEQVGNLVDVPVTVLPTRTIPQGLAALLSFNAEEEPEVNRDRMMSSAHGVQSGEVTYAVRDSQYDGGEIEEGDYLGIWDGNISVAGKTLIDVSRDLLTQMVSDEVDVVTILYGEDVMEDQLQEITRF